MANDTEQFNLDTPLIEFSQGSYQSQWTVRNAVEGVQILGGIGSGKTSSSGRVLALKYLQAGFGGLVLTAKPDERRLWESYCKQTGREDDLIIIEAGGAHSFNFLEYESSRADDRNYTANVVEVLKTVINASDEKQGGKSDDAFWESALDMLIFNTCDLLSLAYGKVSVEGMYQIVQSLPREGKMQERKDKLNHFAVAMQHAMRKVDAQVTVWEASLAKDRLEALRENLDAYQTALFDAVPDARLLFYVDEFFMDVFGKLHEKTRSIVDFQFSGFLYQLLREPIFSLFCQHGSTFTPEDSLRGKIILIDLPVKLYNKAGRDVQILFKYIWQRAMERRDSAQNERPVFLWADEAQHFLHEHDAEFQATARSSRVATVYLSQNLPNYFASMGGAKSQDRVKAFLGTLATKMFHANADKDTNEYASALIGDGRFQDDNQSVTLSKEPSQTAGRSFKWERIVRPEQFVLLKTGGPKNGLRCQLYIHKQGDALIANQSHLLTSFGQDQQP